jgi:potassium efflux system protein
LAGLAVAGYAYSATQLAVCLNASLWSLLVVAVLHGLALRWLLISRRRLALQQMRERAALKEQAGSAGAPTEIIDVHQMDLTAINQQTRRLIDAAIVVGLVLTLWFIWRPVLPALGFLESVTIWEQRGADGRVTSAVTLANLLLAVPLLVLTAVLVRNAPGLLEAAVLRHLPVDNAARYAITSLTSYVLGIAGIVLTAGTLGLQWSSVQWLAAGLSVGLGFGLQEVVANFVCGLILLFEQPIRVGDVVTVDTTTGVVSRIRMRATTVTNWDRQEYIIPNKDLIVGRVTNWTLTDSVNRVEVRVGVAYGTDTRAACGLLRDLCAAHTEILREPAPIVTFEAFGDSTLNLVARFYLGSLDKRLQVVDEVHAAIHEQFAAAGIDIAFPQLDVHLRHPVAGEAPPATRA